ncbi:MAG: class I SAM-dependent methyltransferase [Candidatus Moraniibacteriota bacterium]|nr:MAG: class I SAM-dependent methyltransferase [Candidatus Moranbacteria bacterium]
MPQETYESTYKESHHFSFGKNWLDFLKTVNGQRKEEAKKSLLKFLGGSESIQGKTFIDVGCGSGLFSLAAYELGASRVVSVDIDDFSIACATHLRETLGNPKQWHIQKVSALDAEGIKSLGTFDVVYSWGVLHHTGDMYRALQNVLGLVRSGGIFYVALYNENISHWREGTSKFWLRVKRLYNHSPAFLKRIYLAVFLAYYFVGSLILFRNPFTYIRNHVSSRGMDWYHDRIDWIGGYPYEYAPPDAIINFFGDRGFLCRKFSLRVGLVAVSICL